MSANPHRACGKKSADSCYGEGPGASPGGILRMWTWLLGDGISNIIPLNIPPLVMVVCNPAGTIAARELVKTEDPVFPFIGGSYDPNAAYVALQHQTKKVGVADHVGKNNYSAYSFAEEIIWFAPSRKIPPQFGKELARLIWNHGPVPMLFTHDRMPVFDNQRHLEQCVDIMARCLEDEMVVDPDAMEWGPTWEVRGWSQYNKTLYAGHNHVLIPILYVIEKIERNWKIFRADDRYQEAKDFFKTVRFVEQAFGMSWLAKVTYTASADGSYSTDALAAQQSFSKQVVNFLNLATLDKE